MLKPCLNCGVEFDGAPQAKFHSNACRVAYSRREVAPAGPELEHSVRVPAFEKELAQEAARTLSAIEEQALRDRYGYAKSETRTKTERDAVAARITGKPTEPLPTLEQYVELIRREALAYSKSIGETNEATPIPGTSEFVKDRRKDRLARAERYARWRYAGFLSGECASL